MYIDTIEDYNNIKSELKRTFVTSKTTGKQIEIPCVNTLLVNGDLLQANSYNPNSVDASKMLLLRQSIVDNGFAFPIVTIYDEGLELFVVVDGFHRSIIGDKDWLDLEYVPIVVLKHSINERMTATIQFNKARGVHQVDKDADVIRALLEQGMDEEAICDKLKIDTETVHRYKSLTGIAAIFKNVTYSKSWKVDDSTKN